MHDKQSVFKTRVISWLTLFVFTMLSVMPFPGYAQEVNWNELRNQGLMVSDQLDEEGYRLITTDTNRTVSLTAFDQGLTDKWKFNLGGNNLNFNITGDAATTWSGTTNVLNGILGLFNSNGIHFTDTSRINLTNAGFIGAAMRAVDATNLNNLKLAGNGYLLNEGKMNGGNIALLGGAVENKGTIDAPLNQVTIAGGKAMTVGLSGDNLISVVVDEATDTNVKDFDGNDLKDQIKDSGNIKAHKIKLDAKGVDSVFEKAINLTGEIQAKGIEITKDGEVEFVGGEVGLVARDEIHNEGLLKADKVTINTDEGIYNKGTIEAKEFREHGYTFVSTGTLKGGKAYFDNTDEYAFLSGHLGSDVDEDENLQINGDLNLDANVTIETSGIIEMLDGTSIAGGGYSLTLKAGSGQSILRSMDDLGDLILDKSGSSAEYTLRSAIGIAGDLTVNSGATLDGGFSVTVFGGSVTGDGVISLTGGTFNLIGSGNFGGSSNWVFNNLIFGNSEDNGITQKVGSNQIKVLYQLINSASHELRAGTSTWNLDWGGGQLTNVEKIVTSRSASLSASTIAIAGDDHRVYQWGYAMDGSPFPVEVFSSELAGYLNDVTDIAAGTDSFYAIRNGFVYAWGGNGEGQLGTGDVSESNMDPQKVLGGESGTTYLQGISQISAGSRFALALKDGAVYSWGLNDNGQLGDGTTANQGAPVKVSGGEQGDTYLSNISQISAGYNFGLALENGGDAVYGWGANWNGQLGNGENTNIKKTPVKVLGGDTGEEYLKNVQKISAGGWFSLALLNDGRVLSWGDGDYGELGQGTISNIVFDSHLVNTPGWVRTADNEIVEGVKDIAAGTAHSVLVQDNGKILVAGRSGGFTHCDTDCYATEMNLDDGLTQIVKDSDHLTAGAGAAFIISNKKAYGWGANTHGQLGNGVQSFTVDNLMPVIAGAGWGDSVLTDAIQVISSQIGTLAIAGADKSLYAWGSGQFGLLGPGITDANYPVRIYNEDASEYFTGVKEIAMGFRHYLALRESDGAVFSWGTNSLVWDGTQYTRNVLGNGTGVEIRYLPTRVLGGDTGNEYLTGMSSIAAGYYSSAATRASDGAVFTWGDPDAAGTGGGSYGNSSTPLQVVGGESGDEYLTGISQVSIGHGFMLALRSNDGSVFSWGKNSYGQLGNGNNDAQDAPVRVLGGSTNSQYLTGVSKVATGERHSLALLAEDGSILSWGDNDYNQLSRDQDEIVFCCDEVGFTRPGFVKDTNGDVITGATDISAGGSSSAAVIGGALYVWGANDSGQLGTGDTGALTRAQPNGVEGVQSLSLGVERLSYIDRSQGAVYSAGYGGSGGLGGGLFGDSTAFVKAILPIFNPFINRGDFVAEDSTFIYAGDYAFGLPNFQIQIADVAFNNLSLKNQAEDYVIHNERATLGGIESLVKGTLNMQGVPLNLRKVDMSKVVVLESADRLENIIKSLGGNPTMSVVFKTLFGNDSNVRQIQLKSGINEISVSPTDLGFENGVSEFQKMIFDAETQPEEERKVLDSEKQTDTVLANVTGNARVVASDGKIYQAKEGMTLAKGDQVWTDSSAKVELSNKGDVVTVNSGSAVVVASAPAAANDSNVVNAGESAPVQDLLQIAFGKVSVAVHDDSGNSNFIVQTPNGMSGIRG